MIKMEPTAKQKELDRQNAVGWAALLFESEFLVLDTETSNWVDDGGEVIQLGIVDKNGNVLLNTLLKPEGMISAGATSAHGLTEESVEQAGTFVTLYPYLKELLTGKPVIAYNAPFDERALNATCTKYGLPVIECTWHDAMTQYSAFQGEWNYSKGNYRWWKLTEACLHNNVPVVDAHDATADVKMTLALIQKMAGEDNDIEDKVYDVIIFDIDGTLADQDTSDVYDHVKFWFEHYAKDYKIYLATNQGGVGLRYWMEHSDSPWGEPETLPTETMVKAHIDIVNSQLVGGPYPYKICYAYLSKKGNSGITPPASKMVNPKEWDLNYRKPEPGMLLDIILESGAPRSNVLFVGDANTDREAAERAGIDYMLPSEFFVG